MDPILFDALVAIVSIIASAVGAYLIGFLNQKIGNDKLKVYYEIAKQVVMSTEQQNSELVGAEKKELAISKLLELTNNNLTLEQADTLIEAAVFEIKKLIDTHL